MRLLSNSIVSSTRSHLPMLPLRLQTKTLHLKAAKRSNDDDNCPPFFKHTAKTNHRRTAKHHRPQYFIPSSIAARRFLSRQQRCALVRKRASSHDKKGLRSRAQAICVKLTAGKSISRYRKNRIQTEQNARCAIAHRL